MNSTPSFPEALIVLSLVGGFVAWLHFRSKERRQRVEIVHKERLVAMDKGIPLPELPSEPMKAPADPTDLLVQGVAWVAMGLGGVLALRFTAMQINGTPLWPLALPLLLLGVGLILVHVLAGRRFR